MSEEREPMLSDEHRDSEVPFSQEVGRDAWRWGFNYCRRQYENLITEGKLRVVEDVGYTPADSWCSVAICHGCSEACSSIGEKEVDAYCRNCGRKIKRS